MKTQNKTSAVTPHSVAKTEYLLNKINYHLGKLGYRLPLKKDEMIILQGDKYQVLIVPTAMGSKFKRYAKAFHGLNKKKILNANRDDERRNPDNLLTEENGDNPRSE
jgi:hypothetical protein